MIDPLKASHREKLRRGVEHAYRKLRPFRSNREDMVKRYVGNNYSDYGPRRQRISNLIFQTADIYTMSLAANRPRVLLTTKDRNLDAFRRRFQTAINNHVAENHIEEVLQKAVLDAFFTIGVVKVHVADKGADPQNGQWVSEGPAELEQGQWVDVGKPFAGNISFDDFVFDVESKEWRNIWFVGNYWEASLDDLKNNRSYDPEIIEHLGGGGGRANPGGDRQVRELTTGGEWSEGEQRDRIELIDIYLPEQQRIITFTARIDTPPLAVRDWTGPKNGPYHILTFSDTPDNIMPVSPAMNLKPLDELVNSLLRKLSRQANRQKDLPYFSGNPEDARRLKRASDGEWTRVDDSKSIGNLKMGGVDNGNFAYYTQMNELFSRSAGNLDAMAGLGPQSDTLGQDKLIQGAVGKREAKMQKRVVDFAGKVMTDIGMLLWNDEYMQVPGDYAIPGTEYSVDDSWRPGDRIGEFSQFGFDVDPYSMAYKSPSERLSTILQMLSQVFLPMQQMMEAQGSVFDINKLLDIVCELTNEPRLKEIIKTIGPPRDDLSGAEPRPRQAPHTTRENIRRSVSAGPTPENQANQLMQSLMSQSGPQAGQMAGAA